MLAYVFWHWPNPEVSERDYDALQRTFHAALASSAPGGFISSCAFRLKGEAPWLGGSPAYADWYLLESSAAIDALNVAAVSGPCEGPHAEVAHAMAAGAGSLFALRGEAVFSPVPSARNLTFLTKPRPMPYADFYAQLPTSEAASLWRRALVLGPTPEFALLTPTPLQAPAPFQPLTLTLTRVTE
jgi:hypothetical protein